MMSLRCSRGMPSSAWWPNKDDRLVGFALGSMLQKSNSAWTYGHLVWLGIDSDFQRDGVASKLFRHLRQRMAANGVRMILVDTEADNAGAIKFFKKMGFNNPAQHVYLSLNLTQQRERPQVFGIS